MESYIACGESSSCYKILLHRSKHCLGFSITKYKYDKYSAADKLLQANLIAVSSRGIAFSAGRRKDYNNKAKESAQRSFRTKLSSVGYFPLTGLMWFSAYSDASRIELSYSLGKILILFIQPVWAQFYFSDSSFFFFLLTFIKGDQFYYFYSNFFTGIVIFLSFTSFVSQYSFCLDAQRGRIVCIIISGKFIPIFIKSSKIFFFYPPLPIPLSYYYYKDAFTSGILSDFPSYGSA